MRNISGKVLEKMRTHVLWSIFLFSPKIVPRQPGYYYSRTASNLQHTANQERNGQYGNSTA